MSPSLPLLLPALLALASPMRQAHALEPRLPLPADGSLTWTFQTRTRGEWRENAYDFDASQDAATDDTWLLHRLRLGVEWQPLPGLRVTVQGQDVRETFSDRADVPLLQGAEGDDAFDLRLAALEFGDPGRRSLKLGRQVLAYGDERLVGPLEWLNFGRTFDAVKLHQVWETGWLDVFTASVVRPHESHFNVSDWLDPDNDRRQWFSGLHCSSSALPAQTTDLYVFHLHEEAAAGHTDFVTAGTRLKGDPARLRGWDYTVEAVGQAGRVRGSDLRAGALHLEAGYNWLRTAWKPRLALEYSYGSGDGEAGDGRIGTFQNLFPTNHPPYGFMDAMSWQNLHNAVLRLAAQPHRRLRVTLDLHAFWLADSADAWYRANGSTQVRPVTPGASRRAGSEADLTLSAKLTPQLDMLLGCSRFFAGSYLEDTGAGDDAHFAYLMLTLNH